MEHIPVLVDKVLENFLFEDGGIYVDCTVGAGGHSLKILQSAPNGKTVAIDRDKNAITIAKENLKVYGDRIFFIKNNFRNLKNIMEEIKIGEASDVFFDFGMSSMQLDDEKRGFSFRFNSALDMRMDEEQELSAYDLVNNLSLEKLESILTEFGEERFSRRIANGIVRARQRKRINTTHELVEIILNSIPKPARYNTRIHPATRTFQALRIVVNDEINSLKEGLEQSYEILKKNGRVFVISFHSIEDRIVKEKFKTLGNEGKVKILTKKPITADFNEIKINPRARSAKLRIAEKIQ